jgi:hypothetical protein
MESIRVVVRVRPDSGVESSLVQQTSSIPNTPEAGVGDDSPLNPESCIRYDQKSIIIENKGSARAETNDFSFDRIFSSQSGQEEVWDYSRDLVESSLAGYNATIFAFGMTGSGKTHTISGTTSSPGIVPRTVHHVFSGLRHKSKDSRSYVSMVFLSYIELYNNILYDLLATDQSSSSSNLKIHDHPVHGITVSGSPTIRTPVTSVEETLALITRGTKYRATASTNLNERSSRSHTIITLEIVRQVIVESNDTHEVKAAEQLTSVGKINLVDLAGSERVKMSGAEGQALEEAKQINKALTVLGDVLNSLSKYEAERYDKDSSTISSASKRIPRPHVPYRNSKLTMLLKDSLGGNSKSMMIATIRESVSFYQQTMITLRYASRAKLIQCSPMQNIQSNDSSEAKALRLAVSEVSRLKDLLHKRSDEYNEMKSRLEDLEQQRQELLAKQALGPESNSLMMDQSIIEAKEHAYRQRLEDLQQKAMAEQTELHNHMKGMIHQHEHILSERENDVVILELRLTEQLKHIESLSRDRLVAIEDKRSAELNNKELSRKAHQLNAEVSRLQRENAKLRSELSIALESVNKAKESLASSSNDRQSFTDALQKATASRLKYKNRAEELQISYDESAKSNQEYVQSISSLQRSLDSLQTIIEAKDTEIDSMKKKLLDQNQLMTDAAKTIKRLEKKVLSQREDLKSYRLRDEKPDTSTSATINQSFIMDENDLVISTIESQIKLPNADAMDYIPVRKSLDIELHQQTSLSHAKATSTIDETRIENKTTTATSGSQTVDWQREEVLELEQRSQLADARISRLEEELEGMRSKCKSLSQEKVMLAREWKESYEELQQMIQRQVIDHEQHCQQIKDECQLALQRKDAELAHEKRRQEEHYNRLIDSQQAEFRSSQAQLEFQIGLLADKSHKLEHQLESSRQQLQQQLASVSSHRQTVVKESCDRATSPVDIFDRRGLSEYAYSSHQSAIDNSYPGDDIDADIYDYFDTREDSLLMEVGNPSLMALAPAQGISADNLVHNQLSSAPRTDDHLEVKMNDIGIVAENEQQLTKHTSETASQAQTYELDSTPRKEYRHLRDKINLLQENDKEMLMTLERRLFELNEARLKLLKLSQDSASKPLSKHLMSICRDKVDADVVGSELDYSSPIVNNKQLLLAEERIQALEQDIRHEKISNATLQAKLEQKTRLSTMQEQTIARLEAQLEEERINRKQEIESAVKAATRFIIDNQLRRSHDREIMQAQIRGSLSSESHSRTDDVIDSAKRELIESL